MNLLPFGRLSTWTARFRGASAFDRIARTEHTRQNLERNSVRGFGYLLFSGGGEFMIRLGSTAILARLISPDSFGLFMMVTAVTAIADQFRDLGLSTATIQRETITQEQVSNLFWINAAAGFLVALVVCALSGPVALYFHEPRLTAVTVALASTFVLGGLSVQHEALLGRQMRLGSKSAMRLLGFFLSSVVGILLARAGFGYWALVWREIARSAFIVLGAWFLCPWMPDRPRRGTQVWSLVTFGSGLTATYILGALSSSVDRLLLGRFDGAGTVGLYRQSYQLVVTPMAQLMSPLYQVSLPGLSMLQNEPARFRDFYARILSLVAAASMPMGAFIAVYADELSLVVLGKQWHGAAIFIRIFGLGSMFQSIFSTIGFVLVSRGRSGTLLQLAVANSALKAALMFLGLRWGPVGVGVGDMATTLLMFAPFLYFSMRDSPVSARAFLSSLARPVASSVVLALALLAIRSALPLASPLAALLLGLSTAAVLLPIFWVAMPGGYSELRALRSAILGSFAQAR